MSAAAELPQPSPPEVFLRRLYEGVSHDTESVTTVNWPLQDRAGWRHGRWRSPHDAEGLIADIEREPTNAFIKINPVTPGLSFHQRGDTDSTLFAVGWLADLDIAGPGHAPHALPLPTCWLDFQDIFGAAGIPEPTMVVRTSESHQGYWLADEAHDVHDPDEKRKAAELHGRFATHLKKTAAERGLWVDSVGDLTRVLRPPGSLRCKPACEPFLVRLTHADGPTYTWDEMVGWLPPAPVREVRDRSSINITSTDAYCRTTIGFFQGRVNDLASMPAQSGRHNRLLADARWAGENEHLLPGVDIDGELRAAALANGLVDDDGERNVERTIEDGLTKGRANPHQPKEREARTSPRPRAVADLPADGDGGDGDGGGEPAPDATPEPSSSDLYLPDEFWAARPEFEHIRQAARARMIGPDGLFGAVLARVALLTPYQVLLPPVVGRPASLNFAILLEGASGLGKGSSLDTAEAVLPVDRMDRVCVMPPGSGEGMAHAYFEKVADPENPKKLVHQRVWDGLQFRIDEGQLLGALKQRSGQTTMETIRQGWSGECLGGTYAASEKNVRLAPQSYRMVVALAIQPALGQFILDDTAGGTPQRFVWVSMLDPGAPELGCQPAWPGPLRWRPPPWDADRDAVVLINDHRRRLIQVAPEIVTSIQMQRHAVLTGRDARPDEAHATLCQLKVAALLGILDGRFEVGTEDWELAAMVMDVSRGVRETMRGVLTSVAHQEEVTRAAILANRQQTVRAAEDGALRVAGVLARHVHTHGDDHPLGPVCKRKHLTNAVRSTDRAKYLDQAIPRALALGWITEVEEGYEAGGVTPPA